MLTWEGSWPNSLVRRPPWLHACSVKNKQTNWAAEAFLNVWRWPMKQTIEEKSRIFSAFYQESDLNYRLLGGLICDQFRFNSSSKGVNVMVLEWPQFSFVKNRGRFITHINKTPFLTWQLKVASEEINPSFYECSPILGPCLKNPLQNVNLIKLI